YYTYYHSSGLGSGAIRLTAVWSNGTMDVAVFRIAGQADSTVWPLITGATDLSVTYRKPAQAVCKVVGPDAHPALPCSFPNEILQLTITGSPSGGAGPTLDVTPLSLDFGSVNTGPPGKDLTLTVKNTGSTGFNAMVTSPSAVFTVSPSTSFAVGANSSQTVTV